MDTKRVEVLHVADSDAVVAAIADNLILDLLPALHTALNEHLGTDGKGFIAKVKQLLLVVGETTSKSAEGERSADDDREANVLDNVHSLINVVSRCGLGALLADGVHGTSEELSVLSCDNGVNGCSE